MGCLAPITRGLHCLGRYPQVMRPALVPPIRQPRPRHGCQISRWWAHDSPRATRVSPPQSCASSVGLATLGTNQPTTQQQCSAITKTRDPMDPRPRIFVFAADVAHLLITPSLAARPNSWSRCFTNPVHQTGLKSDDRPRAHSLNARLCAARNQCRDPACPVASGLNPISNYELFNRAPSNAPIGTVSVGGGKLSPANAPNSVFWAR